MLLRLKVGFLAHDEALFNTTYWFVVPEEDKFRFAQTNDALYLLSVQELEVGIITITSPVPVEKGGGGVGGQGVGSWYE